MAYLLMLLSSAVGIAGSACIRQYEKKHATGRMTYLTILCLFSSLFFIVTNKNGYCFDPKLIFYGLLSGFCYLLGYYLTFVAYACGSFALTNLMVSFSLIASIGYGMIVLGDRLSVPGYIGLGFIFASIFFINIANTGDEENKITLKWLLAAFGCFATNAVIAVVKKMQQVEFNKAHDNEYALFMTGSAFIAFLIISLIKERDEWKHFFSPSRLYAVGSGVCNGASNFLSLVINGMMMVSLAGPLSAGITILMNFLTSVFILKEKFSKFQIIGVSLGAAAVVLLSL